MKTQLCNFEISLAIKSLGFVEECFAYYNIKESKDPIRYGYQDHNMETIGDDNICSAPIWQQVIDWFRENHNIHIVFLISNTGRYYYQIYQFESKNKSNCLFFKNQEASKIKYESYFDCRYYSVLEVIKSLK